MALNLPSPAQVKPSFFSDIINPVITPTKLPGSSLLSLSHHARTYMVDNFFWRGMWLINE